MENPTVFSLWVVLMLLVILTWAGYRLIYKPGRFIRQLGKPVISAYSRRMIADGGEAEGSSVISFLRHIGSRVPSSEGEVAALKMDLIRAGFRGDNALPVFYGLRIVATLMMLCFCIMLENSMPPNPVMKIGLMVSGVAAGWVLPRFMLEKKVGKRQEVLRL